MKTKFYYVIQTNSKENTQELLGFNLTEDEKNKLFYSLGKNGNASLGHKDSDDEELQNAYGIHKIEMKDANQAFDELIIKPQQFNDALELLKSKGYDVVKKGVVSSKQKVLSYQMENLGAWKP